MDDQCGESLPALSVCQPFAEAILAGVKRIETRHWATRYRGPLALHASRGWWAQRRIGERAALAEAQRIAATLGLALPVTDYPRGALVGWARLVACEPFTAESWERLRAQHAVDTSWEPGRVAWWLADVRRLPRPVPWSGALGLFPVPWRALGAAR